SKADLLVTQLFHGRAVIFSMHFASSSSTGRVNADSLRLPIARVDSGVGSFDRPGSSPCLLLTRF
ncbi:MAG: hypothetical protein ABGX07_08565, partial [Pirellulaceae bacterium]